MKKYSGIIMEINNETGCIMTEKGEFINVKMDDNNLCVGDNYTGNTKANLNLPFMEVNKLLAACLILFVVLMGKSVYAYYTPITTAIIDINPSIQLKANKWERIISAKNLNSDGATILNEIKVKNKSLDTAISLIVNQSVKNNFIDKNYIENGKNISIYISSKDNKIEYRLTKSIETIENIGAKATINIDGKSVQYIEKNSSKNSNKINEDNKSKENKDKNNNNSNNKNNDNGANNKLTGKNNSINELKTADTPNNTSSQTSPSNDFFDKSNNTSEQNSTNYNKATVKNQEMNKSNTKN